MSLVPRVELHCHLEGAMPPAVARQMAHRNGMDLPDDLFDAGGNYAWDGFEAFLKIYDMAAATLQTGQDFADLTFGYLAQSARAGVIYTELTISPDAAHDIGMDFPVMLEAVHEGAERAREAHGIVSRAIGVIQRHRGVDTAMQTVETLCAHRHPYLVGLGMAGDENAFEMVDFRPAFEKAAAAGLGCTVHAGEMRGAEEVRAAITHLPVTRIGHGVRAIEDPDLVTELARRKIHLEVCPGSNIALGVYRGLDRHPLRQLYDAGVQVSLNSDDPPFFHTSIAQEYQQACDAFGLDDAQLKNISRMALEDSFLDADEKSRLLKDHFDHV